MTIPLPWLLLLGLLGSTILWADQTESTDSNPTSSHGFNEFLLVPLRIHLLSAEKSPDFHTTLSEADMDRILKKINGIWAQAGIHFFRESLVREEAVHQGVQEPFRRRKILRLLLQLRPESSKAAEMLHLYYIRKMHVNGVYLGSAMFVKDTASLREVPGGIDEPIPRVSSHEIGHALRLRHRQAKTNLMASGTTGTALNLDEIETARAAAQKYEWIESAGSLYERAGKLMEEGQTQEAKALYRRMALLPLVSDEMSAIKARLQEKD